MLEWIARGYHASMAYLERDTEARGDPARILDDGAERVCARIADLVAVVANPNLAVAKAALRVDQRGRIAIFLPWAISPYTARMQSAKIDNDQNG